MKADTASNNTNQYGFLSGGGEMGELIRLFDWTKTSLGMIQSWPQSLKTSVNIILQSPVPIVMLWGQDGIMIYNDAYSAFAGQRHPFLLGSKVVEGWPEVADFNRNVMNNGLQGKTLSYKDQQLTLYRNNVAEEVWMDLNYSPIMDESGTPAGVLAIVVETTQRILAEQKQKQAEEALRKSEEHLRALITATSDIIYNMNSDWSEMGILQGRVFIPDIGTPRKDWFESNIPPIDQNTVRKAIDESIKNKSVFQLEHRVRLANGNIGWTFSRAIPVLNPEGEVIEWLGAASDVTERKRAEEALRESEKRFRIQADASPNLVWTLGTDGEITYMNEYGLRFFGTTLENLNSWVPYVHPDDMTSAAELLEAAFNERISYQHELRIKSAAGRYHWVITTANPITLSSGEFLGYVGSSVDISERKQIEDALKESEARFRTMAEGAEILIATSDETSIMTYFNKAWYDFTGRSVKDLLNFGWADLIQEDDRQGFLYVYLTAIEKRHTWRGEFRMLSKSGEYRWLLAIGSPRFRPDGSFAGYISSSVDISERKQAEEDLEAKNELLVRINNDLDNFIYTASHDLKAPMSNIEGLLYALRKDLESEKDMISDKTSKLLQLMEKSIDRFKTTILDLTEISKVQKEQEEDVNEIDLAQVVEDVKLSVYDSIMQSGATIETDFSIFNSIKFSKKNLRSIFYNLLTNAIKYRDKDRVPEIFVKTESAEGYVVLIVKDNGLGISKHFQEKYFLCLQDFITMWKAQELAYT